MNVDNHRFIDSGLLEKVEAKPGVYRLYSVARSGRSESISRVLGTDRKGTLDVGESTNLQRRLKSLKNIITQNSRRRHSAGNRYMRNPRLRKRFPPEQLCVFIEYCDDHKQREKKYLEDYFQQFGELPPLNRWLKGLCIGNFINLCFEMRVVNA